MVSDVVLFKRRCKCCGLFFPVYTSRGGRLYCLSCRPVVSH